MPVWEVSALDRAGREGVVAEHPSTVGKHIGTGGAGGVGHPGEPPQPIIEFGSAAVERLGLMSADKRRDPEIGQRPIC